MKIFATILAGGGGVRLGGVDKGSLRFNGRTLLQHVQNQLGAQVDGMAVSVGHSASQLAMPGLEMLTDPFDPQIGPLGGIYAGYLWANKIVTEHSSTALLIAPVDTPKFPQTFCDHAKPMLQNRDVIVARYRDQEYPTCSLWRLNAAKNIAQSRNGNPNNSIRNYLDGLDVGYLDFTPIYAKNPFKNVNKMSDLLTLSTPQN
ncbi:molybdenum cofactor guanylyltransferase [Maritalea sp.]|uniref:molybdenum cofactor guanylyltransferase n=1 Tax=Maritalea sp. TaxID=2003361 RepID=UPI003EFA39CA